MSLESATWPEIEAAGRSKLLSIPIGSLEQHGPHLPLNTDTRIATELAGRPVAAPQFSERQIRRVIYG